jgi:hypothetical protein
MDHVVKQSTPRVRLTILQLIAVGPLVAEACLIPLVIIVFVFARPLSGLATSLNSPPTLIFVRDQYDFLLRRGVDSISAALPLRLFEFLIWVLIPVGILRIALSPFLFSVLSMRKNFQVQGISITKFYLVLIFMLVILWASTHIEGATSVPALRALLEQSLNTYVFLETLLFVGMSIAVFEAVVGLIEIVVTAARERNPVQSSEE